MHSAANALLAAINVPKRRRVFVSYYHGGDQWFYDEFSRIFHDRWEALFDNSLERQIDSDDTRYVMQRIRDNYITGTSCTIVLIGAKTHERKYVDWEIKASLDKEHGLLGIVLPTHSKTVDEKIIVPDRFLHNFNSRFATYIHWEQLTEAVLKNAVDSAALASVSLINNSLPMKARNG